MPKKKKPTKRRPFYKSKPPKPKGWSSGFSLSQSGKETPDKLKLGLQQDFPHAHAIAPAHFLLRDDGTIGTPASGTARSDDQTPNAVLEAGAPHLTPDTPHLILHSDTPFLRLYHGNSLELLDAIAAKYPEGRFDAIFADPPYFLSNGGISCHAGQN